MLSYCGRVHSEREWTSEREIVHFHFSDTVSQGDGRKIWLWRTSPNPSWHFSQTALFPCPLFYLLLWSCLLWSESNVWALKHSWLTGEDYRECPQASASQGWVIDPNSPLHIRTPANAPTSTPPTIQHHQPWGIARFFSSVWLTLLFYFTLFSFLLVRFLLTKITAGKILTPFKDTKEAQG